MRRGRVPNKMRVNFLALQRWRQHACADGATFDQCVNSRPGHRLIKTVDEHSFAIASFTCLCSQHVERHFPEWATALFIALAEDVYGFSTPIDVADFQLCCLACTGAGVVQLCAVRD